MKTTTTSNREYTLVEWMKMLNAESKNDEHRHNVFIYAKRPIFLQVEEYIDSWCSDRIEEFLTDCHYKNLTFSVYKQEESTFGGYNYYITFEVSSTFDFDDEDCCNFWT